MSVPRTSWGDCVCLSTNCCDDVHSCWLAGCLALGWLAHVQTSNILCGIERLQELMKSKFTREGVVTQVVVVRRRVGGGPGSRAALLLVRGPVVQLVLRATIVDGFADRAGVLGRLLAPGLGAPTCRIVASMASTRE